MILVAGVGNIFLGDDGFGVEAARRLAERRLPDGVQVRDFGIRGMDLAFTLMDPWQAVIMIDAAQRGEPPGTLTVIEARLDPGEAAMDTHGWEPDKVMALAQGMGATLPPIYVIACEPAVLISGDDNPDVLVALSPAVEAAMDEALRVTEDLLARLTTGAEVAHA